MDDKEIEGQGKGAVMKIDQSEANQKVIGWSQDKIEAFNSNTDKQF